MKTLARAQGDVLIAAHALMAYRRGEAGPEALTGAMLEAEHFKHLRHLAHAYLKQPK